MLSIPRGPRGVSRNELSQKSWKSLQNFKKTFKKNFSIEFIFQSSECSVMLTKNDRFSYKTQIKTEKSWQIAENFLIFWFFKCSKRKFSIFEVLGEFWRGLEEPRSYKIYSSGNRGVKKGPGPRGSKDEEFIVPSLPNTWVQNVCPG